MFVITIILICFSVCSAHYQDVITPQLPPIMFGEHCQQLTSQKRGVVYAITCGCSNSTSELHKDNFSIWMDQLLAAVVNMNDIRQEPMPVALMLSPICMKSFQTFYEQGYTSVLSLFNMCVKVIMVTSTKTPPLAADENMKYGVCWWWRALAWIQQPFLEPLRLDVDAILCPGFEKMWTELEDRGADIINRLAPNPIGSCGTKEQHTLKMSLNEEKKYYSFPERNCGAILVNHSSPCVNDVFSSHFDIINLQTTDGPPMHGDQCAYRESLFFHSKFASQPKCIVKEDFLPNSVNCRNMKKSVCSKNCLILHGHAILNHLVAELPTKDLTLQKSILSVKPSTKIFNQGSFLKTVGVFVVGVPRSGTSFTTSLVNSFGPYHPPQCTKKGIAHPLGIFECSEVVALNKQIMSECGVSWQTACFLPLRCSATAFSRFKERAVEIIKHFFEEQQSWVLKDPRFAWTIPIWHDAAQQMGVKPIVLLVYRHFTENVRAIEKHGHLRNAGGALGRWEGISRLILNNTAKLPHRILLHYDRILSEHTRTQEVNKLATHLDQLGVSNLQEPDMNALLGNYGFNGYPLSAQHVKPGGNPCTNTLKGCSEIISESQLQLGMNFERGDVLSWPHIPANICFKKKIHKT